MVRADRGVIAGDGGVRDEGDLVIDASKMSNRIELDGGLREEGKGGRAVIFTPVFLRSWSC